MTLFDYLNKKEFLTEEKALEIFEKILLGMKSLHDLNIIHHNLKLENIFLNYNDETHSYDPAISNFGNAEVLKNDEHRLFILGSPGYIAPEKFDEE